ncbi:MAG: VWA domain-containing protein [Blastocatellia bacterium]
MQFKRISILFLVTLLALSNASTYSQDKSDKDNVKLRAELVQIDVIVTDQNKKLVRGLTREDFELLDNGKPQAITNFVFEDSQAKGAEPGATTAPPTSRALAPGELKRVMAFVVDTLHMKQENVYAARRLLADFVDNRMQPGDLVLIIATAGGSGLTQQFTSDRRLLKRAIDRLHPIYFTRETAPHRTLEARNPGLTRDRGQTRTVPGGLSMPDAGLTHNADDVDPLEMADVRTTLSTMDEMIRALGKIPGRKLGVLISEGLRMDAVHAWPFLADTTALAARANVVFYTIDPRGLEYEGLAADDDSTALAAAFGVSVSDVAGLVGASRKLDFVETQESLKRIAYDTGGTFFGNNNDIKRGLDNLLDENAAYYMLGFQPEGRAWDGKYHKIKVAVRNRPDLTVAYRKGYLAKSDKAATPLSTNPDVAEALDAISSPFVHRDIDLRLTPLYVFNPQGEAVVTGLLHIDASKLQFKQVNGNYQSLLEQVGYIYDANGKAVDTFANQVSLDLKPETYQTVLKRGLVATRQLRLPPGLYQMRLFVREAETRLIGTANNIFVIPNIKGSTLALSSVFMHGGAIKDGKVVPATSEGDTLSQRHFHKGSIFSYEVVIYNAKSDDKIGHPQLEMRARVLRGNQVVFKGEFKPVAIAADAKAPTPIVAARSFQLGNLPPDEYTLEVTVIDRQRKKEALVRQETDFTID